MSKAQDIELEDFDLKIENGDFVINESDAQHIENILLAHKGNWKQHPIVGVGLVNYKNAPITPKVIAAFKRKVKAQLEYDNFEDVEIVTSGGLQKVSINANRKK